MTCGIYQIRHLLTWQRYIGQSQDIERQRWKQHHTDLRCNRMSCRHLQNAWRKYGADHFAFEVIEETSVDKLTEGAQAALDAVPVELRYNEGPCVWPPMRGRKQSASARAAIARTSRERMTPEARQHLAECQSKRMQSEEVRRATGEASKRAWADPTIKRERRAQQRKLWSDPATSKRLLAAMHNGDESGRRAKISKAVKERYANPEAREASSKASRAFMTKPETRKKYSSLTKKSWLDAVIRAKRVAGVRAHQEHWNDPAYQKRHKAGCGTETCRAKKSNAMRAIWRKRKAGVAPMPDHSRKKT